MHRSRALDVLRGLTLAMMIVVNMSIDDQRTYAPLLHASWNGLTPTDLVFPTFLFVVGGSLAYTLPRLAAEGNRALRWRVLQRTLVLFACGWVLNQFPFFSLDAAGQLHGPDWSQARIPGVLQRIALAYGVAALLVHYTSARARLTFSVTVLVLNAVVLATMGDDTVTGNAAVRLDRWLLGEQHLYRGEGVPFDPEGLLGLLPSVVNVLGGHAALRCLQRNGPGNVLLWRMLVIGLALLAAGAVLNSAVPINKKLWSSSYVLVGLGAGALLLAAMVELVDIRRTDWLARPLEIMGRNTLALYLLSELLQSLLWTLRWGGEPVFLGIYHHAFQPWAGDKPGSLAFALAFLAGCWAIAAWLDNHRLYLRA